MEIFAGNFADGGSSDKVWAAAFDGVAYVYCYGKRGASLKGVVDTSPKAEENYRKKVAAKVAEGYQPISPALYGIRDTLVAAYPALGPKLQLDGGDSVVVAVTPTAESKAPRVVVSHVTAINNERLAKAMESEQWGISEKVNGARCPIEWDPSSGKLTSYNRRGIPQFAVPDGAKALAKIPYQVLVDGERLEGNRAGEYVAFDLLEYYGQSIRHIPYLQRIDMLELALIESGMIESGGPTMKRGKSLYPGFHLLTSVTNVSEKTVIMDEIDNEDGEGVILRNMDGPSVAGNSPYELKEKFVCDLDAIVVGTNLHRGIASLALGLIRPSDGVIIDIGSTRSGLLDHDVAAIEARLAAGEELVVKVTFTRVRTVGVMLAESTCSPSDIRNDKSAAECTTDQLIDIFGPSRAKAIELAKPAPSRVPVA